MGAIGLLRNLIATGAHRASVQFTADEMVAPIVGHSLGRVYTHCESNKNNNP